MRDLAPEIFSSWSLGVGIQLRYKACGGPPLRRTIHFDQHDFASGILEIHSFPSFF